MFDVMLLSVRYSSDFGLDRLLDCRYLHGLILACFDKSKLRIHLNLRSTRRFKMF